MLHAPLHGKLVQEATVRGAAHPHTHGVLPSGALKQDGPLAPARCFLAQSAGFRQPLRAMERAAIYFADTLGWREGVQIV